MNYPISHEKREAFLKELTELTQKYNIVLEDAEAYGGIILYDWKDYIQDNNYSCKNKNITDCKYEYLNFERDKEYSGVYFS